MTESRDDVMIGNKTDDYILNISDSNPYGYEVTFCFSCLIKPNGLDKIKFVEDNIKIRQLPLNCTTSLQTKLYIGSPKIVYNRVGKGIEINKGITHFFNQSDAKICEVKSCTLK